MIANEKHVKMAAQLYDMRDKARSLLGNGYKDEMASLGKILTAIAAQKKQTALEVAIDVAKKRELIGMDLMLVMSAVVELTDPTP